MPQQDFRMRDSRESVLSVKILAEKAPRECSSNGVGYELMEDFFLREVSWFAFTESEQALIEETARAFAKALREEGFIEGKG